MERSIWLRSKVPGLQPLLLGGGGFILAWLLPVPVAKTLGGWLRHGFDPWLVGLLFLLFYLLARLESTRIPGILTGGITCVLGLSLAALWTGIYSEIQVAAGMIYFSDAHQYYTDAVRLLNDYSISSFSARHPMPTFALAVLLVLCGGNLQLALSATVFLVGMGIYYCAREAIGRFGAPAAAVLLVIIFFFYRRFTGLPDSENLGLFLGCLGFTYLMRGAAAGSIGLFQAGFSFTSLAMLARPGPLFALPLVLLAPLRAGKGRITRARIKFLVSALSLAAAIGLNAFIVQTFADERSQLFSNFAYTAYGVVQGGLGWEQFSRDYPQHRDLPSPEAENLAFRYARDALIKDPALAIRGVLASYGDFFSLGDRSVFGYLAGAGPRAFTEAEAKREPLFDFLTRLAASVLSVFGLGQLLRRRANPGNTLFLWILLGIFLSIPFLPPRDAGQMRVYAAAIPFLALLPGVGLSDRNNASAGEVSPEGFPLALAVLTAFTAALLVVGPIRFYVSRESPVEVAALSCEVGRTPVRLRLYPDSYVTIREDQAILHTRLPEVQISDFRASLAEFHREDIARPLSEIPAGHRIMSTVNLQDGEPLWVIMPDLPGDLPGASKVFSGCGTWQPELLQLGFGFLYVGQLVEDGANYPELTSP
jgi:hypothetical protein